MQKKGGNVFAFVSAGADTKAKAWAAAHLRSLICVSLSTAASAKAPSSPMWLSRRLQARGRMGNSERRVGVSTGIDTKANAGGGRTSGW